MHLTSFDDFPFHQHPTPFSTAATSDAHFNDGYFVAFYAPDWYFFSGLRLHPNVNVLDGWGAVAHNNNQTALRLSRALHPRADALTVGPLTYEIVEPLRRLRLVLDDNESGVTFDVTLDAQAAPFVEARYQHFKYGAVVNDLIRYTQVCQATGTAQAHGQSLAVNGWHAMRDHSWGVRSSMAVPTGIGGVARDDTAGHRRALRLWVPFQVADHVGFINTHETADGETIDFEGRLDFTDGRSVRLTALRHELEYIDGTRRPAGGTLELDAEDGVTRRYTLSLVGSPADVQGAGYYRGWRDNLGPGIYRGAEVAECDSYDTTPGADVTGPPHVPLAQRFGPTEFPMHVVGPDGHEGMAHFEHTLSGPYPRYGFSD